MTFSTKFQTYILANNLKNLVSRNLGSPINDLLGRSTHTSLSHFPPSQIERPEIQSFKVNECVCVCVWERERERKRESKRVWVSECLYKEKEEWVFLHERERESVCVWVYGREYVSVLKRELVCVCACVCDRDIE